MTIPNTATYVARERMEFPEAHLWRLVGAGYRDSDIAQVFGCTERHAKTLRQALGIPSQYLAQRRARMELAHVQRLEMRSMDKREMRLAA